MNPSFGTRVTIIALLEQELLEGQSAKSRRNRNLTEVQLFHKLQLLKRPAEQSQVHESLITANIKRKPVYYFHSGFFTCQYYLISYYALRSTVISQQLSSTTIVYFVAGTIY